VRTILLGILITSSLAACGGGGSSSGDDVEIDANAVCVEAWLCTPWQTDGASDTATRTCTDQNACGTTVSLPTLTATLPALDPEFYECSVEPALTHGCSMLGCHGTETGRAYRIYARGRLRITGQTIVEPGCLQGGTPHASEECIGSIECRCWSVPQMDLERRLSFDSARGFALGADGLPLADMADSELLAQPQVGGEFAHAGIAYWTTTDPDYTTVKSWLEGATRGTPCNSNN
jgi:hypothetical protein